MTTTPIEQEVTNLPPCPFAHEVVYGVQATWNDRGRAVVICSDCEAQGPPSANNHISEAQKAEAVEAWSRRAAAAEGRAAAVDVQAVWDEAINLVKGLLPELERVNKVELEHGFIGTSYELGQTKDIIELLEAARDASPPTAPHEPRCAGLEGCYEQVVNHVFEDVHDSNCPRAEAQVSAPQREGELKS